MLNDDNARSQHTLRLLCLLAATAMAACGGGGGDGATASTPAATPPTSPAPTPPTTPPPPPPPPPSAAVATAATQTRLSLGWGYTLALQADGTVLSWGNRMLGGSGVPVAGTAAKRVSGLTGISAVRATTAQDGGQFEHSLVLTSGGQVLGWGYNGEIGALGVPRVNGSVIVDSPVALAALGASVQVEGCGGLLSVALRADGSVWMLPATAPFSGEPGSASASAIAGLTGVTFLGRGLQGLGGSASACHMHVVDQAGVVRMIDFAHSSNLAGYVVSTTVSLVTNLPPVSVVQCSHLRAQRHCLALATDGRIWGWGDNVSGQLGDGTRTTRTIPVPVLGLSAITQIAVNENASFAIDSGGKLYSWGGSWSGHGGVQTPEEAAVPTGLPGFEATREVAGGYQHACALKRDGSVWCWGVNGEAQLGNGSAGDSELLPQQAVGIQLN